MDSDDKPAPPIFNWLLPTTPSTLRRWKIYHVNHHFTYEKNACLRYRFLISNFKFNIVFFRHLFQFRRHTQLYKVTNTTSPTGLVTLSACTDTVNGWDIRNTFFSTRTSRKPSSLECVQLIAKLDKSGRVTISGAMVPFGSTLRVLGVSLHSEFTFDEHITVVVRACNFHLRTLRHIRHIIDREAANTIACSVVCSCVEYCNFILYGVTENNIGHLQRVQNALARVVCGAQ